MIIRIRTMFARNFSTGLIHPRIRGFRPSIPSNKLAGSRAELKDAKRVVVKLGSGVVTKPDRNSLALGRLATIVEQMADLCNEGRQCVLVTSGAVALGRHHLGRDPLHSSRGARAALGMAEMVSTYSHLFEECDLRTAAMLLTPIDFDDDHRRAYWRKALQDLMDQGVVPIINTNDAVAWDEEAADDTATSVFIRTEINNQSSMHSETPNGPPVRDNDSLAARLACELSSDLLLLVSDVDGVYTAPPGSPGARFITQYEVEDHGDLISNGLGAEVSFGSVSSVGTGGMQSKVESAAWTVRQGTSVIVCRGSRPNCIIDAVNGLDVGTFFKLKKHGEESDEQVDPIHQIARNAREASVALNSSSAEARAKAIENLANLLESSQAEIILENTRDMRAAEKAGLQPSLLARLQLGPSKIKTLSDGLKQIAEQCRAKNGHVGCVINRTKLAEDLILDKITAPIGVLMVIFESRPDCLPQVAALSIATANGLLAKPGSEALHTVRVLHSLTRQALESAGLPGTAVGLFEGRKDVQRVLGHGDSEALVDLVIPRGSPKMIKSVRAAANEAGTGVPVLGHGAGICHVYVDKEADVNKAVRIVCDSKCDYPAACNAMETLLVHRDHVESGLLEKVCNQLRERGVELFAGPGMINLGNNLGEGMEPAPSLSHEYGELQCTVDVVENFQEAIDFIARYGSAHTESIVTENVSTAEEFLQKVDSACVFHNASTRFADGYRFGLGAEVGINTGRIHARGPVGIEGLLTTKWILRGTGQAVTDFSSGKQSYVHEKMPTDNSPS
ncbi:Delta-1-pyrroline-5-carboxylate synthetase [Fasciola hepatica]|uniref:Delta-1-pyrroline-5-carboxylate synthase n=1 Tax=Fasciola hepatica TaxID=6192 RepID=A0A4E0RR02_FASHE|nr:Delta-1-pyrroline-5-carboxylate synthetase [Fasciola hepatica]